jgi:phosphatidylglycerol lysyltransferase
MTVQAKDEKKAFGLKERLLSGIGPILGILLFCAAIAVLRHELHAYHYRDVIAHLHALPPHRILLALALTVLSYLALTGYDTLAVRFIRNPLPYRKIALASFISYVFSHNVGLSFLGGSAVRYRLLSGWKLTPGEIARVIAFNVLTFWLGYCALTGTVTSLEPFPLPPGLGLPVGSTRAFGFALLLAVAAYLAWGVFRKTPLRRAGLDIAIPPLRVSVAQIAVSFIDWTVAAAALYVLLPPATGPPFLVFVGAYLVAQILGVLSNVPAGLGVFETLMIVLLRPYLPGDVLLGSLLAYRFIYYLFPLIVAVALLGGYEALRRREFFARAGRIYGDWAAAVIPRVFAVTVFIGGIVLLASGATPAAAGRMAWLHRVVPLPFVEVSHFVGSLIGAALLLLARGLQQRADAAYHLSIALLVAGVVASLLKGLDYEEAIILGVTLAALLPCRRYFYRKTSLLTQPFSAGWISAILLTIMGALFLVLWSHKHVEYSNDLWWQFSVSADAPRSMRASVGVLAVVVIYAIAHLLRPAPPRVGPGEPGMLEKVRALVASSPRSAAHLALLGDKSLLFNKESDAFVMYGVQGRSWISMGDPIGPKETLEDLAWSFRELSDRHGGWTVFYEVGSQNMPLYLDLGLKLLKLGEEARVSLERFTLEGGAQKGKRHTLKHVEKEGCEFTMIPEGEIGPMLPRLREVSDAWLADKSTREKGFSLGFFDEPYLKTTPTAVIQREGKVVAFANIWLAGGKEELSPDLMRYSPDAPQGVMDYLFVKLMLWGKEQGYRWFNLGMAPLSGFEDHALAPLWNRVGALLFRQGEQFYNFQGLRQYKEKFDPEWEPRYLATPTGIVLPRILANLAALVSGGLKGVVSK